MRTRQSYQGLIESSPKVIESSPGVHRELTKGDRELVANALEGQPPTARAVASRRSRLRPGLSPIRVVTRCLVPCNNSRPWTGAATVGNGLPPTQG
ncbi:hypothetical protein GW17_00060495 [Ensete ventricosum]|nr:hypothetical protein GW17_00060495 [Ensete ventricosum]